jgi:DNA-binding MarR family transcriptional regulator
MPSARRTPAGSSTSLPEGDQAEPEHSRLTNAQLLRAIGKKHARAQRALIAEHGIPMSHCTVLSELGHGKGVPVMTLAARLRIDKGWVSRVTHQMIADGLLRRDDSVSDQRVVSLRITRAGQAAHRRTERILDEQMERIMRALQPSKTRSVRDLLEGLLAGYEAELAEKEED